MTTGYFNVNDEPYIKVDVSGALGRRITLDCLIDTGFTGFLSIPLFAAFPIGLILTGVLPVTLADGSTQPKLMCLGKAHLGSDENIGIVIIEPAGKQVLLGMEFLAKFNRQLVVDPIAKTVDLKTVPPPLVVSPASPTPPNPSVSPTPPVTPHQTQI